MKRGSLRFSEEKFRELAEGRAWQKASEFPMGVGPHHTNHVATVKQPNAPVEIPERDVLKEVLGALTYHPRVAWARRMNSGAAQIGGRWVKFGFEGCPDIIGMLRDGRTLCVEVKRAGKNPTQEQVEFLGLVHRNNGLAFVARSAADARNALNEYPEAA